MVVKQFRLALLTVVVFSIFWTFKKHYTGAGVPVRRSSFIPWFLLLFVAMVILNSTGVIPALVSHSIQQASQLLLIIAVAAPRMKTSFQDLAKAGWRPIWH